MSKKSQRLRKRFERRGWRDPPRPKVDTSHFSDYVNAWLRSKPK